MKKTIENIKNQKVNLSVKINRLSQYISWATGLDKYEATRNAITLLS